MNSIAASPEFADAQVLRDSLLAIQKQTDMEARIASYAALVGVNASDPAQLAEFVGARDLSPYVEHARTQLQLSPAQADTLVETLNENLLNGLND